MTCLPHRQPTWNTFGISAGLVLISAAWWFDGRTVAAAEVRRDVAATRNFDVVVYGGTSGGVATAVQVSRMGRSVVLIEPGRHIGGLTSGGLGATDIGNKGAIGGISREFFERIHAHYSKPEAWTWQKPTDTGNLAGQERGNDPLVSKTGRPTKWTFEPHVAEKIFREMLAEAKVPLIDNERLDLNAGVTKREGRIVSIRMESGLTLAGRMFIDASYEGDLMAKAVVSYHVGREANATYGETLNGVQVKNSIHHQFIKAVDPFVKPGDPASALLPLVQPGVPEPDGTGDRRVQAYNFRMCTTDVPANRRPWPKPADYDERRYELLLRNCEAGDTRIPWNPIFMPNRKTDTNNNFAISTDHIGANYDYPDGDYATRERIFRDHVSYQQGLLWTLANHPRVPEKIREHFQRLGLAKDEFVDHDNWPHQIYVREARRMVSDYVMTQHNCQGRIVAEDSVGLAAYTMDSHNIQRYARDGRVWNEGDVQVGGFSPYPISYRSIVPKASECGNLFVPVCLAASHIAYGSIRMEPVFMVLGQSSAIAAVFAIESGTSVQRVDYAKLRERLLADNQILDWTGQKSAGGGGGFGIDPKKLAGLVVDDDAAEFVGEWASSSATAGYVGTGYRHDSDAGKGDKSAKFTVKVPTAGKYEVRLSHTANPNRATNVPVLIEFGNQHQSHSVNQRQPPGNDGFRSVGTIDATAGQEVRITVSTKDTDGHVIVDAVQLVPSK
jgi:hypothetical protein